MAARIFRVSISPESAPDVRRVLDLDGRATLHDLHVELGRVFAVPPSKAGYAFFTSGRAWDASAMYVDPRAAGRRADKALLFRLGLEPGRELAYVLGFEVERHFTVRVLSVSEATHALPAPVLVESAGELGAEALQPPPSEDEDEAPEELRDLVPLAEKLLTTLEELEPHEEELARARAYSDRWDDLPEAMSDLEALAAKPQTEQLLGLSPLFRAAGQAALQLLGALRGDVGLFARLDEWLLEDGLGPRLLDLPLSLSLTEETDLALELARALHFVDPDLCAGDVAVILARAGRREEALAQVEHNLSAAEDEALAEAKAGDAYRALGDMPAAEAYYRRSLAVAKTSSDRLHAVLRLAACLLDSGRDAEAHELMAKQGAQRVLQEPVASPQTPVGRNEPCACGSGKKFKKCHGV
jgi:tetratricopeptide (TPR) repeat protein